IEAGERIGIETECQTSVHLRPGRECIDNPNCTDGRVPVGSVLPVVVLPVVAHGEHHTVGRYIVFTGTRTFEVSNSALPVQSCEVDLSVYGPAESLIGRYAVVCEDARWQP